MTITLNLHSYAGGFEALNLTAQEALSWFEEWDFMGYEHIYVLEPNHPEADDDGYIDICSLEPDDFNNWLDTLNHFEALNAVMTPAQIEREFNLSSGVVRNMLDGIPHARPDQRTILIPRAYAEARWKNRK